MKTFHSISSFAILSSGAVERELPFGVAVAAVAAHGRAGAVGLQRAAGSARRHLASALHALLPRGENDNDT